MELKNLVLLILTLIPGMITHSFGQADPSVKGPETIYTVNGLVSSNEIKLALTHEHVMSNLGRRSIGPEITMNPHFSPKSSRI